MAAQIDTVLNGPDHDGLVRRLIDRWRDDSGETYRSWFLWDERFKNFRSIRRGITQVVSEIERGTFGVAYRGSSLETIIHSVAEQRQTFKGADHAFLWRPKLRIPDIYESPDNQRAFGRLLDACLCCDTAEEVIGHIHAIDRLKIKGLGPAVANLLYFLHPTLVPPFNTAIVRGYNALTGANVKLGNWEHFLAMRTNDRSRAFNSSALGTGCLERLPDSIATSKGADSIRLTDVLWLSKAAITSPRHSKWSIRRRSIPHRTDA